jgi:hypothetical protein
MHRHVGEVNRNDALPDSHAIVLHAFFAGRD